MHSARVSIGKTSLAVRYAALAPAEAKKKMTAPNTVSVTASGRRARSRRSPSSTPESDVGAGDHLDPADAVEQRAEQQRAGEVAGREDREVPAGLLDAEERGQGVAVGEEERVVEERLADEQREAQHRALRVEREHRLARSAPMPIVLRCRMVIVSFDRRAGPRRSPRLHRRARCRGRSPRPRPRGRG